MYDIDTDQLLLEVIEVMLKQDKYVFTVSENRCYLRSITFAEIIGFLTEDSHRELLFHKFNFTVNSMLKLR